MKRPSKRSSCLVVLMTSPRRREARRIADVLLRERAVSCVGIFPRGESFYWWEGRIDRAEEFLLVAKTAARALPRLIRLVKANHAYQVPEIVALPIVGGNEEYLKWVGGETKETRGTARGKTRGTTRGKTRGKTRGTARGTTREMTRGTTRGTRG